MVTATEGEIGPRKAVCLLGWIPTTSEAARAPVFGKRETRNDPKRALHVPDEGQELRDVRQRRWERGECAQKCVYVVCEKAPRRACSFPFGAFSILDGPCWSGETLLRYSRMLTTRRRTVSWDCRTTLRVARRSYI